MKRTAIVLSLILLMEFRAGAETGETAASFLEIHMGAEAAALGGAYSALAVNAHAPVWNPAGLGWLESTELGAQHLSYLDSSRFEYLTFAHPFQRRHALGASAQVFNSGDIDSTDASGNSLGEFSSTYGAYSIAYGFMAGPRLSLGVTGKSIQADIAGVDGKTFAFDAGSLLQATDRLTLAAVVKNMGGGLRFLTEEDPLPLAFHFGGAYRITRRSLVSLESVLIRDQDPAFKAGMEINPIDVIALRAGYQTDTTEDVSPIAGLSMGLGLRVLGHSFSYAWVMRDELGDAHNFSLLIRFDQK